MLEKNKHLIKKYLGKMTSVYARYNDIEKEKNESMFSYVTRASPHTTNFTENFKAVLDHIFINNKI
jgi:mRNA deadenylase 3'-5' endonuclease subunit Ccr4